MGLALVYSNLNQSEGAISVGLNGKPWNSSVYYFAPESSGYENAAFSKVAADGNIYYYHIFNAENNYTIQSDKGFILKLENAHSLWLQYVDNHGVPLANDFRDLWNSSEAVNYIR